MGKILLIIGLPGSGKTTYVEKNRLHEKYTIFDEFIHSLERGWVTKALRDGKDLCLIDALLCRPNTFNGIMKLFKDHQVEIIVFENAPEQCLKNKPHMTMKIKEFSKVYNPKDYNVLMVKPVYSPENQNSQ